ncbi:hypothetical protein [Clostridium sp.]|nr:hypothetical protein [Clostridium sp.]MDR3593202.1 hypothetical protein [Clostridium sp.]
MKENNKSKMPWNVPICSIAALFKGVYFSSGKEADWSHSGPIRAIC